MATLATDLTIKLRQTIKAEELTFRNWSDPDAWVFAIYTPDDSYIGCVEVVEATRTMRLQSSGSSRLTIRERQVLEKLCTAFNRL